MVSRRLRETQASDEADAKRCGPNGLRFCGRQCLPSTGARTKTMQSSTMRWGIAILCLSAWMAWLAGISVPAQAGAAERSPENDGDTNTSIDSDNGPRVQTVDEEPITAMALPTASAAGTSPSCGVPTLMPAAGRAWPSPCRVRPVW